MVRCAACASPFLLMFFSVPLDSRASSGVALQSQHAGLHVLVLCVPPLCYIKTSAYFYAVILTQMVSLLARRCLWSITSSSDLPFLSMGSTFIVLRCGSHAWSSSPVQVTLDLRCLSIVLDRGALCVVFFRAFSMHGSLRWYRWTRS